MRVLREATPVARVAHTCDTCRQPVSPGERYRRTTILCDNRPCDVVTCRACEAVIGYVETWSNSLDGWSVEIAYEWACEQVRHGGPDEQRAARDYLERIAS